MTTHEQCIADDIAYMEATAEQQHLEHGTSPWAGLDNGAELPSADWAPDTTKLRAEADRWAAIAAQYEPETCHMCSPSPYEHCRCNGISTPRRRT